MRLDGRATNSGLPGCGLDSAPSAQFDMESQGMVSQHTACAAAQVDTDAETDSDCGVRVVKLVQTACSASEACCRSPAWVALSVLAGSAPETLTPERGTVLKC